MDQPALPFLYILISGCFLGTFGLGMKRVAPLSWEAWWLIYSTVGMLLIPVIWAWLALPNLFSILAGSVGTEALEWGGLFGFLWGIGGITFGLSVRAVGMALTYGIVMGLSSAIGSLVPFLRQGGGSGGAALHFFGALTIMLIGVGVCTYAGVERESRSKRAGGGMRSRSGFGLFIALVSGVMSSLLAIGFDLSAPITGAAARLGVDSPNVSLARWVAVCAGAFVMNAGYALVLLFRNRSWNSVREPGAWRAAGWGLATGAMWFLSFGISGLGIQSLGPLGLSVGWPMLLGLGLVISTGWSVATGEWKGARGPFRVMLAGVIVLIAAICLLGYARSMA